MNRQQAINYLRSSGFSTDQITGIIFFLSGVFSAEQLQEITNALRSTEIREDIERKAYCKAADIVRRTIYEFFDDAEEAGKEDMLLLAVNKAICNKLMERGEKR